MEKVARAYLDKAFHELALTELPDFEPVKPLGWAGLSKGAASVRRLGAKGPSIFVFTSYLSDRDRVFPYLAWSRTKALPPDGVEDECAAALRGGASLTDLLGRDEGILSPTDVDPSLASSFEPPPGPVPATWQAKFLSDPRVRGYLEAAMGRELTASAPLTARDVGGGLFSFTLVASFAPELMDEEALAAGYGNVVAQVRRWIASLKAPLRELEANLSARL